MIFLELQWDHATNRRSVEPLEIRVYRDEVKLPKSYGQRDNSSREERYILNVGKSYIQHPCGWVDDVWIILYVCFMTLEA